MSITATQKKPESKAAGANTKIASRHASMDLATPIEAPLIQRKSGCACGGGCPSCQLNKLGIQPKLKVGAPNDKYEQEADRVADQVMRMPEPNVRRQPSDGQELQTKALNGIVQRQAEAEEEETLQTKATPGHTPTVGATIHAKIQSLEGGGQPLPANQRTFFESRMGQDFSGVRIHTDSKAADTAQTIQAKAFTLGNNIIFNAGQYSSDNQEGKKLLAHELTHVVQQNGGAGVGPHRAPTPFTRHAGNGDGVHGVGTIPVSPAPIKIAREPGPQPTPVTNTSGVTSVPQRGAAFPTAPASAGRTQFGIPADKLSEMRAFARKHGVRLYVRQPNPHSARHIDAGAAAKPMEVKAKTINIWDTHLHPKIGLEQRGLVGYFKAELPKDFHSGKYTKWQRRKIRQRRKMRLEEFGREAPSMKLLEGTAPDRGLAVRVKDGVVHQIEPDSVRRFEGGPHERRPRQIPQPGQRLTPLAGDIDVFDLTDTNGKPLSRARYAAMDTALVEAGLTEHGAHMRWEARGEAGGIKRAIMAAHGLASGGADQLVRIGPDGMTRVEAAEFKRIWPKGYEQAQGMERRKARKEAKQASKGAKQASKKARKKRKRKTEQWADKKVSTKRRRKAAKAAKKARRRAAKLPKTTTPSAPTTDTPSAKKPPKVDLGDLGSAKVKLPGGGRRLAKILSGAVVQAVLEMVITELIQGPYRRELAELDGKAIQWMFQNDVAPALATRIQTSVMKDLEDPSNAGTVARNDRLWLHFPWYLETKVVAEDWKDFLYLFSALNMELYEEPHRAFVIDGQVLSITASPKNPYRSGKRKIRDEIVGSDFLGMAKGTRYHTYQQVASVIVHDALAVSFVKQLASEEKAIRKRIADLRGELRGMYLDGAVPPRFARQFRNVSKYVDALWLRPAVVHLEALARMMKKEDDLFPLSAEIVVDDIVARQKRLKGLWGLMDSDSQEMASATAGKRTVKLVLE